jgi:tRNA threonylcarbamoyladenosine biosynthesis protein TsaB
LISLETKLAPAEPIILSLETATLGGSMCLSRGAELLATRLGNPNISHSNTILADINACLTDVSIRIEEVDLFACASGPGSFTGLRIGIATVKALAATLDRPCVGIPTLAAIARGAGTSQATIALLPAGRGEVFAQQFQVSEDEVKNVDQAAHLSPEKLMTRYGSLANLIWAGPAAQVHRELISDYAEQLGVNFSDTSSVSGWRLAAPDQNLAQHVALLALKDLARGKAQEAEALRAIYVRPSDAEINQPWQ